ncbi:hypothetical protein EJ110_NYTH57773 [Nymphaea thermarum]|nr:hypothetical protein EJ110_NYTH57773 [Nymphaea thermarum]
MKSSPFSSLITKMHGGNYEMWAMQMKRTLIAHDKEHLILELEPVQKVGKYTTWFKDNSLVMVWIVGTLSQDIANEVLHKESAKDIPSIPPIDEAYSRLSRIPIPASTVPDTTSAMLATRGRGGSLFARGPGGRGRGNTTSRPVCQFCRRIGYTVDKCWQKHGRPAFANQTASTDSPEQPKAQHTASSSELRVDDIISQLQNLIGDRPQHAPDPTTSTITTAASASSSDSGSLALGSKSGSSAQLSSPFREIVGSTEELSNSSLCSSPDDNNLEGMKVEEIEALHLRPIHSFKLSGAVLAVCPYLERYLLLSASNILYVYGFVNDNPQRLKKLASTRTRFTITCLTAHHNRIAVGDCRDGILFYSYLEDQNKLEQLHCDPCQRLVADCALVNLETAFVSDRRGSVAVLSSFSHLEGKSNILTSNSDIIIYLVS